MPTCSTSVRSSSLILGDLAEKAPRQVHQTVRALLLEHHAEADADRIATALGLRAVEP